MTGTREFVARLGKDDTDIAARLIARITDRERARWSAGTPAEWAMETYDVAKSHAYGLLPPKGSSNRYELSEPTWPMRPR